MRTGINATKHVILLSVHALGAVMAGLAFSNEPPRTESGTLGFAKQVIATGIDETHAVVTADFDGDGDLDAAATDFTDGQVLWFENDGALGFTTHLVDGALGGSYPLGVADLDGDLDPDLLAAGYLADTYVWYENNGNAGFVRHEIDTAVDGPHSLVAWDPDQDGDWDLLASNQDGNSVFWYENDGLENFTRRIIDAGLTKAKRAEAADFDGDGDLDVVACSNATDEVVWYENDGSENFSRHSITLQAEGAYFVVAADLDNDGDQDIAGVSQLDHKVAWYRNDGGGSFAAIEIDTNANGARMVQAGDLDGDGDEDLVVSSVDDNTIGWYENDGSGGFAVHEVDEVALGAYGVWMADMDGDGAMDVLSASRDGNEVALQRQVRAHEVGFDSPGATVPLSTSVLHTTDPDNTADELIYTVSPIPQFGALKLFGVALLEGETFSQSDIDAGGLTYEHDGSAQTVDGFAFTVSDGGAPPLSGYVRFELGDGGVNHWPLDESAGVTADDVLGGHNGLLQGGPVWDPAGGRIGGALDFDGADDRVDLGAIDITNGDGLTLAMWVRPSALRSSGRLLAKATGTAEQDHYWMVGAINANQLRFRLKTDGVTTTLIAAPPVLAVGQWLHISCTYDGAGMRIYGNGVLLGSAPKTGSLTAGPTVDAAIGNQPTGAGTDGFAGLIDDVRIFNRALPTRDVIALMNGNDVSAVRDFNQSPGGPHLGRLLGNSPNPFNPLTRISYEVRRSGDILLDVFNLKGQSVLRLAAGHHEPGTYTAEWDGRDHAGRAVASGTYFYRLVVGPQSDVGRMMLVR